MPSRQCLQSLKHVPRRADAPLCSKKFHTSSSVSAMPVSALPEPEITIAPIFDIFDVPVRLGQSQARLMGHAAPSQSIARPRPGTPVPRKFMPTNTKLMNSLPVSLPPPITFDGPACPRHPGLVPHLFAPRAARSGTSRASSTAAGRPHSAMGGADRYSDSEVLIQVFDGPARISRYSHKPDTRSGSSSKANGKSGALVIGAAGAVAAVALAETSI